MAHRKAHLPSKTCPVCGRPLRLARRGAHVWPDVKFCSAACRGKGKPS